MSYGLLQVFTVHRNNDDRSDGPITDFCSSEAAANACGKGRGWYGGNASVRKRVAICVDGKTFLLDEAFEEPIDLDGDTAKAEAAERATALAKLTPRERALLGAQ